MFYPENEYLFYQFFEKKYTPGLKKSISNFAKSWGDHGESPLQNNGEI